MLRKPRTQAAPEPPKALRVAGYGRVSCGKDAMLESLSNQVSYFSKLIQNHPGWEFAGVYADEAYTGTKNDRPEFQRLLADCREGKIDLILVKAISRLARNTVTLLATARELKALGVDIYFEEQDIHTLSAEGELMLTLIAAVAQEESRSVSENCKWRIQKQFEVGELATLRFMYGYNIQRGVVTINHEEADIVRGIFADYISGIGATDIAKRLTNELAPTMRGGEWTPSRVRKVLLNEKYAGNAVLQKTYIADHLSKKKILNRGERESYFAEGTHSPIIDVETFERAQAITAANREKSRAGTTPRGEYPFSGLVFCGRCGKHYIRKVNSGRVIWHCATYLQRGKACCAAKAVPDDVLTMATTAAPEADGLGLDDIDMLIEHITVPEQGRLIFHLRNGSTTEYKWTPPSRRDSWDCTARERAREHARKRYAK